MARDHRKLRVFHDAHRLILAIYRQTRDFPRDEWFGLRSQIRRSATSIAANIVEGSARRSAGDYVSFINIARASAGELCYLIDLAHDLEFLPDPVFTELAGHSIRVLKQVERLLQRIEPLYRAESQARRGPRPHSP
jgi:four helix bundle protein